MATLATPARQPFGILNESKLRTLQSIKNRQNALTPCPPQSLKRRAPSPETSDSENIDPYLIDSSSKRKRAAFDEDVSLAKQPRLTTHLPSSTKTYTPPPVTKYVEPLQTGSTPMSAPPAAGRSPTRLRGRYDKSRPKRRFAPPSLKTASPSISIAAALRGTLAHKKPIKSKKATVYLDDAKPKSWFFDIFEESEEQQDYRMSEWTMTQSSAALELSDDENKGSCFDGREKGDKGKENIDPNEMFVVTAPVTRAAAAASANALQGQEAKHEEPRSPLGNLNAADFYAEGLDATSVVLVHEDAEDVADAQEGTSQCVPQDAEPATAPASENLTFDVLADSTAEAADAHLANEPIPEWARQTSSAVGNQTQHDETFIYCDADAEPAEIEIWESQSAKDENENREQLSHHHQYVVVGEGQTISLSAGCLQELL